MNTTNEFSFILEATPGKGVGVFAMHDIAADTELRLFGDDTSKPEEFYLRDKESAPESLRNYCIDRPDGKLICPTDFGRMEIGWYLNHSNTPNATHQNYIWRATQHITAGEEVLIDYNSLEEPEELKDEYYSSD